MATFFSWVELPEGTFSLIFTTSAAETIWISPNLRHLGTTKTGQVGQATGLGWSGNGVDTIMQPSSVYDVLTFVNKVVGCI